MVAFHIQQCRPEHDLCACLSLRLSCLVGHGSHTYILPCSTAGCKLSDRSQALKAWLLLSSSDGLVSMRHLPSCPRQA